MTPSEKRERLRRLIVMMPPLMGSGVIFPVFLRLAPQPPTYGANPTRAQIERYESYRLQTDTYRSMVMVASMAVVVALAGIGVSLLDKGSRAE